MTKQIGAIYEKGLMEKGKWFVVKRIYLKNRYRLYA